LESNDVIAGLRREAQREEAFAKLGTSPQGTGTVTILDSRVSEVAAGDADDPGRADWMRFRVEIRFPANVDRLPVPDDWK